MKHLHTPLHPTLSAPLSLMHTVTPTLQNTRSAPATRMSVSPLLLAALVAFLSLWGASTAWAETANTQNATEQPGEYGLGALHDGDHHVESRLIVSHEAVPAGGSFRVGVAFTIDPEWHIYWQNPGDAGIPTDIRWEGEGIDFGPLEWAAPSLFDDAGSTSYGYDNEVVLFSEATVQPDATGTLNIRAKVDYLACSNMCLPGHSQLARNIEVGDEAIHPDANISALMERSKERVPRRAEDAGLEANFYLTHAPVGGETEVLLELIECHSAEEACRDFELARADSAHAFLADGYSALNVQVRSTQPHPNVEKGWLVHMHATVLDPRPLKNSILSGVLRLRDTQGGIYPVHVRHAFDLAEEGETPAIQALPEWFTPKTDAQANAPAVDDDAAADAADVATIDASPAPAPDTERPSFIWIVLMAFLGGIILNLMPCVFPVLVLKISAFVTLAHESRRQIVIHGSAYTLGIIGSMMVLAAVVIGLRLTGNQVGWGFQFQQPYFLAALVVLLVGFALNLFGVFEISVQAQKLTESADKSTGVRRSIMEGVLAVVLATPCSAPFMGAAIGFALTGSIGMIVAVFFALGLGLAAPMVVLTLMPGWARLLPPPGNWMVHLKTFLGFALMGSGLWIAWLLGRASGVDAMTSILMFSGLLAVAAWLYGLVQFQGWNRRKITAMSLAVVAIGVGAYLSFPLPLQTSERGAVVTVGDVEWHPWTEEAVQAALDEGRPVFVDFTADWCLTCKVNKRNAIDTEQTAQAIAQYNVATFRADWTHENEDIRAKLEEHNRAGIPFYLVYNPAKRDDPELLAEVITPKMLVDAFRRAARGS